VPLTPCNPTVFLHFNTPPLHSLRFPPPQYFGFKDWDKEGEAPAWMEVVRATGLKFRFVSYNLRKKYEPTITTNQ